MKLTLKKLDSLCEKPCIEGREWFINQKETDLSKICMTLIEIGKSSWCEWLIPRLLNKKQRIQYAVYAAELVIDIFEKEYPDDKRPREAINAAKNYIKNPIKKNKDAAAYAAAYAADAAAYATAYATAYAANAAAYAANANAANAANAAAYAAYAAASAAANAAADAAANAAADAAADAAAYAAYAAARKELQIKIAKFGIKLLSKKK